MIITLATCDAEKFGTDSCLNVGKGVSALCVIRIGHSIATTK